MTLVEMLVATAMCIAGMWMLTWMFQQATASFSLANAQADRVEIRLHARGIRPIEADGRPFGGGRAEAT